MNIYDDKQDEVIFTAMQVNNYVRDCRINEVEENEDEFLEQMRDMMVDYRLSNDRW